jgi:hypothetical protein
MKRSKNIVAKIALLCVSILLIELALRIIPSPIQYSQWHEYGDPDSLLGVEIIPSTKNILRGPCFKSTVTTNSLGWRDRERTIVRIPGITRIAFLGDSYIEGAHVEYNETITQKLEENLGKDKFEVLNFGLSSIGTVQQDILYEYTVEEYDPDIVIASFYVNDVMNNHPELEGSRLTYRNESGELIHDRTHKSFDGLRKWLRVNSALFRLAKFSHKQIRNLMEPKEVEKENHMPLGHPDEFAAYGPPPNDTWEEAWRDTEQSILDLKARIEPDRKFFLLLVPSLVQTLSDPAKAITQEFGSPPADNFDPLYPHIRLTSFAEENGIELIDPLPDFSQSLFLECDGHWNSKGHEMVANKVYDAISSSAEL